MNKMRIVLISGFVAAVFILTAGLPASGGDEPVGNMQIVREALRANKKLFVAENMDLTVSENQAFWQVYDSYQKDLGKLGDRFIKLIEDHVKNFDKMSNEDAKKNLNEYLAIESERIKLRKAYLEKFLKVIPVKKVLRYYQLENKFASVIHYDLAARIPLAQ
jgi:hypothetical protein